MTQFTVEAYLKATGAEEFTRAFREANEEMKKTGDSANEASGGIGNFMGGLGKIAGAIGITKLVSAGFDAIKNSVGDAVDRVDTLNRFPKLMEAMGFSSQEAESSVQKLTDGIQGLPTTLDSVVSTAQGIAILTGDLDGATDTTLALNNAFLASGSSSADAERGLTQYVQMLSKGEVDMQSWRTLQETMGVALNDTAKAFGFAGESAQNDLYKALQDGTITFDEFNDKIIELDQGVGGFAERALIGSEGIKTSMQNIKTAITTGIANAIQTVNDAMEANGFGSISDNLDKVKVRVQEAFATMVDNISVFVNFVAENLGMIQILGTAIGILATAFGIYSLSLQWAAIQTAIVTGATTFLASAIAFLTSPITLVVLAIGALIAVLVYFYNTNETVRLVVDTVWNFIQALITTVVSAVVSFVMEIWGVLVSFWAENHTLILSTVETIWNRIKSVIQFVMDYIVPFITISWEAIKGVTSIVWDAIKGIVEIAINLVLGIIKTVMQIIDGDWSGAWETVKSTVSNAWESIKTIVSDAIERVRATITDYVSKFVSAGKDVMQAVADGIVEKINNAISSAKEVINGVIETFKETDWLSVGSNIIAGIGSGISASAGALWDAAKGVLGSFKDNVLGFFGIKSPSRLMADEVGKYIPAGIGMGIEKNEKPMLNAAKSMSESLMSAVNTPTFDIGGQIAQSNGQVNAAISHNMNMGDRKRPMQVNLSIGGRNFNAFVEDVSNNQDTTAQLELAYL